MTVSYPMSMKLHEKYPEMGEDSYWVWDEIWIEAAPGYQLITREKFAWKIAEFEELDGVVPTPALTLGELVRWCMDNGLCHISLTKVKKGVVVTISHQWNHDVLSNEDADTPEQALAAALIAAGGGE